MTDRFDKFTERARKVLQLAQEEAQRFNHNYIGTEHILLGLVREGDGVAARVLNNLGIELYKVRSGVEFIIGRGDRMVMGEIGLTPRAKRVLELAADEARRLNHHYIGTEHLLLGLIREGEGIAAGVLESLGVSLEKVRAQVIEVLKGSGSPSTQGGGQTGVRGLGRLFRKKHESREPQGREPQAMAQDRFDKFTERARKVLQLAQEEAQRFNHNYIGTEHILLGLVREDDGVAAQVLSSMGIELHKVRSVVEFIIGRGDRMVMGEIGLTPRAKRVIELAVDEARRLNYHYIGTEHLLLGLIREGEGIAARVLESQGVSLEKVRARVLEVLKSSSGSETGQPETGQISVPGDIGSGQDNEFLVTLSELIKGEPENLTQQERQILRMRYGLTDDRPHTLEEVSQAFGITRERVRQIETRILRKLRTEQMQRSEFKEAAGGVSRNALEHIITLFDYTIWARDQLLGLIEKLDDDALRKAPEGGAYGSIFDTLVHMAVSEWMWIRRCLGESPSRLPKVEDFASLRVLIDWWNQAHADAASYLSSLTDADLEQEVTYTGPDGKARTRKVWHMLLQVVNHQTEHRSQVASMLGQMGFEVPQTDLVVYLSK